MLSFRDGERSADSQGERGSVSCDRTRRGGRVSRGDRMRIFFSKESRGRWVKEYLAEGEQSFIPKGHPGNPFAALHTSKKLSELDRLRLMVAKLEIENARLKKGYWVEGVGANRVYVTGSETITKSSKNSE